MAERPQAASGRSPAWFVANGLVFLACLVGLARVDTVGGAGKRVASSATGVERVRLDWWETRRSIYGGTPARALFQLPDRDGPRAQALSAKVWRELDRLGHIFNSFDATSEVGKLNAAHGPGTVPLSADLYQVLVASLRLSQASDGAFDPTIWPIRTLWHDAVTTQRPPTDAEIAGALSRVGLGRIQLSMTGTGTGTGTGAGDGSTVVTLPAGGAQFDFGGIAKGYAVDRVVALLRDAGVQSGLVALGGEISTFGDDDGKPWRIGVQHPRDDQRMWGVITVHGELRVSTSGNYRQPLQIAGKTYYHIMDPRTGRPVSTAVEGVTTMDIQGRAKISVLDGVATAIVVLGPDAGLAFARRLGIDVLMLVRGEHEELHEVMTDGFRAHFRREGA